MAKVVRSPDLLGKINLLLMKNIPGNYGNANVVPRGRYIRNIDSMINTWRENSSSRFSEIAWAQWKRYSHPVLDEKYPVGIGRGYLSQENIVYNRQNSLDTYNYPGWRNEYLPKVENGTLFRTIYKAKLKQNLGGHEFDYREFNHNRIIPYFTKVGTINTGSISGLSYLGSVTLTDGSNNWFYNKRFNTNYLNQPFFVEELDNPIVPISVPEYDENNIHEVLTRPHYSGNVLERKIMITPYEMLHGKYGVACKLNAWGVQVMDMEKIDYPDWSTLRNGQVFDITVKSREDAFIHITNPQPVTGDNGKVIDIKATDQNLKAYYIGLKEYLFNPAIEGCNAHYGAGNLKDPYGALIALWRRMRQMLESVIYSASEEGGNYSNIYFYGTDTKPAWLGDELNNNKFGTRSNGIRNYLTKINEYFGGLIGNDWSGISETIVEYGNLVDRVPYPSIGGSLSSVPHGSNGSLYSFYSVAAGRTWALPKYREVIFKGFKPGTVKFEALVSAENFLPQECEDQYLSKVTPDNPVTYYLPIWSLSELFPRGLGMTSAGGSSSIISFSTADQHANGFTPPSRTTHGNRTTGIKKRTYTHQEVSEFPEQWWNYHSVKPSEVDPKLAGFPFRYHFNGNDPFGIDNIKTNLYDMVHPDIWYLGYMEEQRSLFEGDSVPDAFKWYFLHSLSGTLGDVYHGTRVIDSRADIGGGLFISSLHFTRFNWAKEGNTITVSVNEATNKFMYGSIQFKLVFFSEFEY